MTEHMEKATQSLLHIVKEVNDFACASVDASLKSVAAAAKGCDETMRSTSHMVQENMSRMMSVGKSASELKNPRDLVSAQQEFMKDCMDFWMASATKLSEISARTAKDVVEPVAQHANDTFGRIMQKARTAA